MFFKQDLDGQITPQVAVTAPQHGPHTAAVDLPEDLDAPLSFGSARKMARPRATPARGSR